MRSYEMSKVAKLMNDLYDELVDVHGFASETADELTVAYFKGGYTK